MRLIACLAGARGQYPRCPRRGPTAETHLIFPELRHIFADRVYRGKQLLQALSEFGKWFIEIVTRSESTGTFKPEPKRWVIERTFAWLNRCRRLSKDFEETIASAEAWVLLASIRVLSRRLARA